MVLIEVLEKVRQRIAQHGAALQQNEMLTRYVLIDPVLRALGWDTEDPDLVIPECTTPNGRPDYVLRWNGQNYIALEAKALRGKLPGASSTGFHYCWFNKIPCYIVSDGDTWELYDMTIQGGKLLFNLQITQESHLGQAAYTLMRLYRAFMPLPVQNPAPALSSGGVGHGATPAAAGAPVTPSTPPTVSPPPSTSKPTSNPISLASLHQRGYPVTGKRPQQVVFPDKTSAILSSWKDLLIETVKYLDRVQKLPPPPYAVSKKGKSFLYNTEPKHPSGSDMLSPVSITTTYGTIDVESHGSAVDLCKSAYTLLTSADEYPNDVLLTL